MERVHQCNAGLLQGQEPHPRVLDYLKRLLSPVARR